MLFTDPASTSEVIWRQMSWEIVTNRDFCCLFNDVLGSPGYVA